MSEDEALSKQEKRVIAMFVVIIVCAMVGITSAIFLGKDNPVEQTAEIVIDETIENSLNLPDGSINIDLTPDKK